MGKIKSGHDAAGEKMPGNPVGGVVVVETIGSAAVVEDMEEKLAIRFQPGTNAFEEHLPIRHMFEHFDRYDAIKVIAGRKIVHVCGHHGKIGQPALTRAAKDGCPLRCGIGDRRDPRIGKTRCHIKRQRTPAAAEFENVHAVLQLGMVYRLGESSCLRFIEACLVMGIIAAGIFPLGSENQCEKFSGDFIVLPVRLVGMAGDGEFRHIRRKSRLGIRRYFGEPPFRSCAEHIYSGECNAVAERRAFCGIDGKGEHIHGVSSFLRGPGKKALTRRCRARNFSPRDFSMCSSSGGMPETWTSSQYIMTGAASDAQDKPCA